MTPSPSRRILSVLAVTLVFSLGAVEAADAARRGGGFGSFGSRGMRTYQAPRATPVAPGQAAPIQRSMTPRDQTTGAQPGAAAQRPAAAARPPAAAQQPSFLRRWGGPIMGGLLAAGLFGMLMGHGFGGAAGMMALLMQVALIACVGGLLLWLFRRRSAAAQATAGQGANVSHYEFQRPASSVPASMTRQAAAPVPAGPASADGADEIGVGPGDFDAFERLLDEVQGAMAREDYAALRERTTPEVMSFLAEELSQIAVSGRRNEVSDVRLLQGDLAEAWREDERDYATVAMRYSSIDVMLDRATGALVEGDPDQPTETTELWTFVRDRAGPWGAGWKLSAIQALEPEAA